MSDPLPGPEITVVIPSIPIRQRELGRALASVSGQTYRPQPKVVVEMDPYRTGAAATRTRGLMRVDTEFVAFLDDDDELFPRHLELLVRHQQKTGADVVYPWFDVIGGTDPFPDRFGQPFDAELCRTRSYIPITVLARTEVIKAVGGFREHPNELGWTQEDWVLWNALIDAGATISHLPKITWSWWHHGKNTSGNARNW